MTQGQYISENTQDLLRRAEQILGNVPVLDLTNWQDSISMNGEGGGGGGGGGSSTSCNRLTLKNVITVTNASLLVCTGTLTSTCSSPGACPTGGIISPDKYVNMVAIVNLTGNAQTGVKIQFNYLINDVPITDPALTRVTVNLVPGNNTIYLFPTNHTYSADTTITLYGAMVV